MIWTVVWVLVTLAGIAGTVASVNGIRFSRRVAAEIRTVAAAGRPSVAFDRSRLTAVPPPVQRYLSRAITRSDSIVGVRLHHHGRFRTSLDGKWLPIQGEQYFRTDPPAFVWHGSVRLAPGIWVDARDRSVDGVGNMFVTVESTKTVADISGPQLDQAALLRLLGEMVWFPTSFLDARYVTWTAIDDRHANATLRVGGREVTGQFEFGPDDLPSSFRADRFRDVGGGRAELTPFIGRTANFRSAGGILVPYRATAVWFIGNRPSEYADFLVDEVEFDAHPR